MTVMKFSCSSFRGDAKHRTRNLEIPIWSFGPSRNDVVTLTFRPKNLPCLRRARNLAPRPTRAGSQCLDQLTVRGHLGAVAEIERILEPGAQMTPKIRAALMQRPDFGAADRRDLPMRVRRLHFKRIGSSSGSAGMPEATPITRLYSSGPEYMPVCRYMPTQRTMPTSKHSNSGIVSASFIALR